MQPAGACRRCHACGSVQAGQLHACIDCGAGLSPAGAPAAEAGRPLLPAIGLASAAVLLLFALARWL